MGLDQHLQTFRPGVKVPHFSDRLPDSGPVMHGVNHELPHRADGQPGPDRRHRHVQKPAHRLTPATSRSDSLLQLRPPVAQPP